MWPNRAFQEGNCFPHSVHALAFSEKREFGFLKVADAAVCTAGEVVVEAETGAGVIGAANGFDDVTPLVSTIDTELR